MVFLFDAQGGFISSARAGVDFKRLWRRRVAVRGGGRCAIAGRALSRELQDRRGGRHARGSPRRATGRASACQWNEVTSRRSLSWGTPARGILIGGVDAALVKASGLRIEGQHVMKRTSRRLIFATAAAAAMALVGTARTVGALADQEGFRFKSGVELINVNVTVTDRSGRFVPNLRQEDFVVYEDDKPIEVTHLQCRAGPGESRFGGRYQWQHGGREMVVGARRDRSFPASLPDEKDEFFIERSSVDPGAAHDWTNDRNRLSRALSRVRPNGGTAMHDAVAEAVPRRSRVELQEGACRHI